jgi:hypothetical protein
MTDPKRWIDDGAPEDVRELLEAASREQPRRGSTERALTALGASGALAAARSAGAAPAVKGAGAVLAGKGAITSAPAALAIKWGLLGVVTALATAGTAAVVWKNARPAATQEVARSSVAPASAPRATAVVPSIESQGAPSQESTPAREIAPPLHSEPSTPAPAARAPLARSEALEPARAIPAEHAALAAEPASHEAAARETAPALAGEVAVIDEARADLRRGDLAGVLATLNAYDSRFAVRRLEPEALYLRMEALGRQGDTEGRRKVAERLLAEFPGAPQAARARAVLESRR